MSRAQPSLRHPASSQPRRLLRQWSRSGPGPSASTQHPQPAALPRTWPLASRTLRGFRGSGSQLRKRQRPLTGWPFQLPQGPLALQKQPDPGASWAVAERPEGQPLGKRRHKEALGGLFRHKPCRVQGVGREDKSRRCGPGPGCRRRGRGASGAGGG